MPWPGRRRPPDRCSGIVVTVGSVAEADRLARDLRRRERFDLVEIDRHSVRDGATGSAPSATHWDQVCEYVGIAWGEPVARRLRAMVPGTDPEVSRFLLRLTTLHLGGGPFVLVVVDPARRRIGAERVTELGALFGAEFREVRVRDLGRRQVVRPARPDPRASLPPDLVDIVLGPDDRAVGAVRRWLTKPAVQGLRGFSVVAPAVAERIHGLGIPSDVGPLIEGLRRRAWYRNALVRIDAERAIGALRADGIEPTVLGDLAASLEADRGGRVRPVGELVLLVHREVRSRAEVVVADALADRGAAGATWRSGRHGRRWLPLGASRSVGVTDRWLRANGDRRVPLTPDLVAPVSVGDVVVAAPRSTARVLDLWIRAHDLGRHDRMAVTLGVMELMTRQRSEIDVVWLDRACADLDLTSPTTTEPAGAPARRR